MRGPCSRRAAASRGERSGARPVARDPPVAQSTKRSEPRPRGRSADAHARSTRRLACCGPNRSLSVTPSAAARRRLEACEHPERAVGDLLGRGRIGVEHVAETRAPTSSAPANWSVENGQTSSGTPAQRASVTVLFPPWQIARSHERSTSGCGRYEATPVGRDRSEAERGVTPEATTSSNGQRAKRRDDALKNVRARGEEAAERDVDARPRILRLEERASSPLSSPPRRTEAPTNRADGGSSARRCPASCTG